jgi:hypothetical protein
MSDSVNIYEQPDELLMYRGIVKVFHQRRGYGFIIIKSLIRSDPNVKFSYDWLQPLGKTAMVHYNDIVTDFNIEKDPDNHVILRIGQIVYFNLILNESGRYQATNLISETIMTSSVNVELSNTVEVDDDKSKQ